MEGQDFCKAFGSAMRPNARYGGIQMIICSEFGIVVYVEGVLDTRRRVSRAFTNHSLSGERAVSVQVLATDH